MTDEKYIPLSQVVHAFERLKSLHDYHNVGKQCNPTDVYSNASEWAYQNAMDILLGNIPLLSNEVSE